MWIVIFVPSNVHSLELAGLMDVFAEANARAAEIFYEVTVVAEDDARPIRCGSGLKVLPDLGYSAVLNGPDTLLVAGSVGVPNAPGQEVIDWLTRIAPQARRYGSVCTGAFLLGDAGLLEGRRVATHWQYAPLLAERFPDAKVDGDRVFIRDGALITSAGSSAAIARDARGRQPRRPVTGQEREQIERPELALFIGACRAARCRARATLGVGAGPRFCHSPNVRTIAGAFKRNGRSRGRN